MQLWDAGPVRVIARSHKRGAAPVIAKCREAGCTNSRRLVQGARYCEEHARGKDYAYVGRGPTVLRPCKQPTCNREFQQQQRLQNAVSKAWNEYCSDCHNVSPLTLTQLQAHHTPTHLVTRWLNLGARLPCDICGKTLTRRNKGSRPVIDHDHRHCRNGSSCGTCIRGVVCVKCNTQLGHLEALLAAGLLDQAVQFVKKTPYFLDTRCI